MTVINTGFRWLVVLLSLWLGGCSVGQMVARTSVTIMDGSIDAMNRETDYALARDAIPANLKLMEGLLAEDPGNLDLRLYAAQGFYGYAFGFVELSQPERAAELYRRGYEQAREGLRHLGLTLPLRSSSPDDIRAAVAGLPAGATPLLFWAASNWANQINLNRTDPSLIAQLAGCAALMEHVLERDEYYYYGGPHLFFGVYYGSRAPMFGGDYERALRHFELADGHNDGRLLLVDVLHAEYLSRQQLDREGFHRRLTKVMEAPTGLLPEMELANVIAKRRAEYLLAREKEWF